MATLKSVQMEKQQLGQQAAQAVRKIERHSLHSMLREKKLSAQHKKVTNRLNILLKKAKSEISCLRRKLSFTAERVNNADKLSALRKTLASTKAAKTRAETEIAYLEERLKNPAKIDCHCHVPDIDVFMRCKKTTGYLILSSKLVRGINPDIDTRGMVPLDFFRLYFTDEIVEELCKNINDYGNQRCEARAATATERSVYKKWRKITPGELFKFFAVIIAMGITKKPSVSDYWNTDLSHMATPWFRQIFRRDRFQHIFHTMLHACELDAQGKAKIEPFVSSLLVQFQAAYYPTQELSLDEMVIGWKGRWAHKQYNATKPSKYHVKTFGLCESESGYVINLRIYFGAQTSFDPMTADAQQSVRVFETLLSPLVKGHHIYADRYYTSMQLLNHLREKQFYFTGTVNANRKGFPAELKTAKLAHREIQWYLHREKQLLCVLFRDKKAKKSCAAVSNSSSVATVTVKDVEKPSMINAYNFNMNGCDRVDQAVQTYGMYTRKSTKWWKKIFFWIFEVSQVNAHILHMKAEGRKTPLLKFKHDLISEMCSHTAALLLEDIEQQQPDDRGHIPSNNPVAGMKSNHFAVKSSLTRVCRHCNTPTNRKRTSFYCKGCPNQPFLHPTPCFEAYHLAL
ncbi:piggyBac transposable element-derived protein 4 [Aplysia californica]|uniref:PiggyBac transposable element-derived protein 4 n=1 Tax=Aplysia californica TaxID=6500 RepID=A0ABM0JVS9_APLCA|nr:piggyBac transposable element-derived protein 4 [Aplysia californica]